MQPLNYDTHPILKAAMFEMLMLRKGVDQALIPISTIQKFPAPVVFFCLKYVMGTPKNRLAISKLLVLVKLFSI